MNTNHSWSIFVAWRISSCFPNIILCINYFHRTFGGTGGYVVEVCVGDVIGAVSGLCGVQKSKMWPDLLGVILYFPSWKPPPALSPDIQCLFCGNSSDTHCVWTLNSGVGPLTSSRRRVWERLNKAPRHLSISHGRPILGQFSQCHSLFFHAVSWLSSVSHVK